jgi:hypothetical protein
MMKERIAAIVIGGIMLLSVAGFAIMGLGRFAGNQETEIPYVVNKVLDNSQLSGILRTGRIVIRNIYEQGCIECITNSNDLEIFTNTFKGYIVLESVSVNPENYTVDEDGYVKFEMISPTGDIVDLKEYDLDQETLADIFCEISVMQPQECLLREVSQSEPYAPPENMENMSSMETENTDNATNVENTGLDNNSSNESLA